MKRNISNLDRTIRLVLGVILIALFATQIVSGTIGYVVLGMGIVSIITGLLNWCALYALVGLNTNKNK